MLKNKFGKKAVAAVMAAAMTVSATAMGLSSITASAAATDVATYFHVSYRHNRQILNVQIVQYSEMAAHQTCSDVRSYVCHQAYRSSYVKV